jgi:hypothetical protein
VDDPRRGGDRAVVDPRRRVGRGPPLLNRPTDRSTCGCLGRWGDRWVVNRAVVPRRDDHHAMMPRRDDTPRRPMPGIAGVGLDPPKASWPADRTIPAASWPADRTIPAASWPADRTIPAASWPADRTSCARGHQSTMMNSTRRFLARPSDVSFSAMGRVSP